MERTQKPLTIYYCGREACESSHSFGPAVRAHYLIHFILKGTGTYTVKGKTYSLSSGQAFLIRPQEVTYYQASTETPWEYVWIAFDGPEAEQILSDFHLLKETYLVELASRSMAFEYLSAVVTSFQNPEYSKLELLGYFYLIFACIQKEPIASEKHYDKNYYQKAITYIRQNYAYPINVSTISHQIGIERSYLYKIFQKYAKCSPKQYLIQYRLLAAKEMLVNTPYSITEIALSCGFHDSSSFCKSFQKDVLMSPLKYRISKLSGQ